MSKARRIATGILLILLIAVIAAPPTLLMSLNNAKSASYPKIDGQLQVPGLEAPVEIYRDKMGIPHIYASSLHDIFMAQGYIHAQERFWQMDFWRHIGSGRLSEMFGESQLDTDQFLRTLGWRQLAEQEYTALSPQSKAILDSYTQGVNAYIANRKPVELSFEYMIIGLISPSYKIEAWTPIHSLTWAKAMAWDLRGNMGEEIERAVLLKSFSLEQVNELFPPYPADHPRIVTEIGDFSKAGSPPAKPAAASPVPDAAGITSALQAASVNLAALNSVLGPASAEIGSNSWAVSGALTNTGMPLLANDPHLSSQLPSIWFQVGLHCQPQTAECPLEVAGFSFAGVPGVVIGHNDRIAWGFTNVGPDVMDLYILKVNPQNPDQYEFNGQWVDFQVHDENITVAGGDPVKLKVRVSRFGPVISDAYGPLKDSNLEKDQVPFKEKSGVELPETYAVALRWTALEPGSVFEAIWGFNSAQNWQEFRAAGSNFVVPAQNLLYADVDGNIGYQMPGRIPMRKNGNGRLPVPGWTDEYEWTGYIPFEELPYTFNPPAGYIVTANNQVNPDTYPYLITQDWDYGFRAQEITDMLKAAPGKIDIAYIQKMQGDNHNLNAESLLPVLLEINPQHATPNQALAFDMLKNWNRFNDMDSQSAAVFEWFWWNLLQKTFNDEAIPASYQPSGGDRWYQVMRNIIQQPDSQWWDDKSTKDQVETRDDIFQAAFVDAVATMEKNYGTDKAKWPTWGTLHAITFRNQTLGKSGIGPIEDLLNRGPFPTAGGSGIVNATGWDLGTSFETNWLPSMRMIVDLSNLDNSFTVHTTGQSGHADHPHYIDMADLWRNIQYYPMHWEPDSVKADSEGHLTLTP
jgi:penicillin amidase